MAFMGSAFLAIWNGISAELSDEFDRWHTGEHIHERLCTPGILAARRYQTIEPEGRYYFTLYEAERFEVFASEGYFATANSVTEWTERVHKGFTRFSRSPCHTMMSTGKGIGGAATTIRLTLKRDEHDRQASADQLNISCRKLVNDLRGLLGVTAVHVGLAEGVSRPSLRAASLNNRADVIGFDAVIMVESISVDALIASRADMDASISLLGGIVANQTVDVFRLAQYLLKHSG